MKGTRQLSGWDESHPEKSVFNLAEELGNVAQARRIMQFSSDNVYRYRELYDQYNDGRLREISHCKPNTKNRVADHVD